jgi:hypothetical protein
LATSPDPQHEANLKGVSEGDVIFRAKIEEAPSGIPVLAQSTNFLWECLVRQLPNRQNDCLSDILQPYKNTLPGRSLALEVAVVGEQFSVVLFSDDSQHKYVRRFVSAQEACRAFQHYSRGAGAQLGLTVRVIVTDSSDCIVREWKYGGVSRFRRI